MRGKVLLKFQPERRLRAIKNVQHCVATVSSHEFSFGHFSCFNNLINLYFIYNLQTFTGRKYITPTPVWLTKGSGAAF